ncbi:amidohydrolase family protein [Streptomyces sp. NEAU-YJ-81]|uniref:amidohydrolase family protein n=1 Tax=Streptomyces sp. NEAU-YJ-81 TaxID=2820288 RepID=UPI001ABC3E26|nr:amidohydrolase family protein [Streptomyces sp. NEAU-YJ-81]MBO3682081.1 amidohydrolase [Streptomyces sp. NEAU-YJ-81]
MTTPVDPLIDIHAHFVTDRYIEAARSAGHHHPDGMTTWPRWDAAEHLLLMDRHGIRTAVLSLSSPGVHFGDDEAARRLSREVNEYGAGIGRRHPGRFGHFACLPLPDVAGAMDELAHCLDVLGSDGVAVMTNTHGVYLGDPRYEPLWSELDRRRAVVFVHPTSPPRAGAVDLARPRPMLEFVFDSARTVSDLVFAGVFQRHPAIQWVFTHGGGALPLLADRMELFRTLIAGIDPADDTHPSVQEQIGRSWFDMAGTPFPHQIPALAASFGTDRILYGSDYCWTPTAGVGTQIASLQTAEQPSPDTWRALTTRNAERLMPQFVPQPPTQRIGR